MDIDWKCQLCNATFKEKMLHCHIEGCQRIYFPNRPYGRRTGIRNIYKNWFKTLEWYCEDHILIKVNLINYI